VPLSPCAPPFQVATASWRPGQPELARFRGHRDVTHAGHSGRNVGLRRADRFLHRKCAAYEQQYCLNGMQHLSTLRRPMTQRPTGHECDPQVLPPCYRTQPN